MSDATSATSQGITPAVVVAPVPAAASTPAPAAAALSVDELAQVRDLAIAANPGAVPELIRGGSVAEINASIEGAKSAYQQIVDRVRGTTPEPTPPTGGGGAAVAPIVPAGGASAIVDVASLSPAEKIRRGLEARRA